MPSFFDPTGMSVSQHEATSRDGTGCPTSWSPARATPDGANPPCSTATAASRSPRSVLGAVGQRLARARRRLRWPTSAAAASSGPLARRRRSGATGIEASTTSSPWPKTSSPARSPHRGTSGIEGGKQRRPAGRCRDAATPRAVQRRGPARCRCSTCGVITRLLAGASWVAEYGDPDQPDEWAWISQYSPYQNVPARMPKLPRPCCSPPARATTACIPATPARWRRRWNRWATTFYYFENTEGGHGSGVTSEQQARTIAITYAYLWQQLGK